MAEAEDTGALALFDILDSNSDGTIDKTELLNFCSANGNVSISKLYNALDMQSASKVDREVYVKANKEGKLKFLDNVDFGAARRNSGMGRTGAASTVGATGKEISLEGLRQGLTFGEGSLTDNKVVNPNGLKRNKRLELQNAVMTKCNIDLASPSKIRGCQRTYWEDGWGGANKKVTDDDCLGLISAFAASSVAVQSVSLDNNIIMSRGAACLAFIMLAPTSSSLQRVTLNHNLIGDAGAKALALSIAESKTLQEIYLGNNGITDAGAADLSTSIAQSTSLIKVGLDGNTITDASASALVTAINKCATLVQIFLEDNNFTKAGMDTFDNAHDRFGVRVSLTASSGLNQAPIG